MTNTSYKTTLAVDAMGGDFGPEVTVPAILDFLVADSSETHKAILVGLEDKIRPYLDERADRFFETGRLVLHSASEVVGMDEAPALALKRKKDSSMRVAINLVKDGQAQAAVSAGNTGALMATARFVLKTIPGISRPAIIATMPSLEAKKTLYMLDLGANVDSSPEMLVQFAVMASILSQYVDKKDAPQIALLNVGAEEIKGSEKVKQAANLLKSSSLNYVGFIEADEILHGRVDVIVCDGFEGNIALKASEGTAKMIMQVIKEEFKRNLFTKTMGALAYPVFKTIGNRLDPRQYNGATFLGLNGIVVKSHGGTDRYGFLHALQEASVQADRNVIGHIQDELSK